jgi:hypothetical protein
MSAASSAMKRPSAASSAMKRPSGSMATSSDKSDDEASESMATSSDKSDDEASESMVKRPARSTVKSPLGGSEGHGNNDEPNGDKYVNVALKTDGLQYVQMIM